MRMRNELLTITFGSLALAVASVTAANEGDLRVVDAAKQQDEASVRDLLTRGTPADVAQPDGFTALHWAAQWNHAEIADRPPGPPVGAPHGPICPGP